MGKLVDSIGNVSLAFSSVWPSWSLADVLFGVAFAIAVCLIVRIRRKNAKKYRKGVEYGSARWGTKEDIEPYMDRKNPDNARNKNILVIGGSGSGKTRFFIKPNLMQLHSSYVVTDPKGTLFLETGKMFADAGYEIKVFNTVNFSKSMHYNPFAYIRSEKDILKLVNALIKNTSGEGSKSGEDFWVKAEALLYQAYIGFIHSECMEEEQNFSTLLDMLNMSDTREDDEMGLEDIGERKTILYMIMSDTDSTFNFILALMQSQMFNLLCERADDVHGGRLPVHVRFLLDEFANIGQIPQFDKLIATIRSREISASIVLQSKSQLKSIYKDAAETIEGNCDSVLFLGGRESSTLKEMSDLLGKETIDIYSTSDTRGTSRSVGTNYQKAGKALMTQDELSVMDGGKCILQVRGARPFLSDKYDITRHPRYRELSDFDERNTFDIERHLSTRLRLRKDEMLDVYDFGEIGDGVGE